MIILSTAGDNYLNINSVMAVDGRRLESSGYRIFEIFLENSDLFRVLAD
jgi:hypothetical protein